MESSLGLTTIEEDLIKDHPDARTCDRRHPTSPGGFGLVEFVADGDGAIATETQRATRCCVTRSE
jgi:hypothetical protein